MKRTVAATAAIVISLAPFPSGHRLDEYLQATRVTFARARVAVEIDLTPGASVAETVIGLIDRDADGRVTTTEAETYGRSVLTDVQLDVDGDRLALTLDRVEVPSMDEMRHGLGTIQVRASSNVERRINFRRQLDFRNNHHPESSVYLVNALVPTDNGIAVVRQTRDTKQRNVRIDYSVTPQWPKYLYWPLLSSLALFFALRRTRTQSLTPNPKSPT